MRFQQGTSRAIDSLGQPYLTFRYAGDDDDTIIVREPIGYTEVQMLWAGFWQALSNELADAKTVEWRSPPTLEKNADDRMSIYVRFSVIERANG